MSSRTRSMLSCWLLVLLLAAGAAPFPASSVPRAKDSWIRLQTAHFTLFSNAGKKKARRIAISLETLRAALGLLFGKLQLQSPLPTQIFVFKDEASFQPYRRWIHRSSENIGGFFLAGSDGNFVAINADIEGYDALDTIYHEYLHSVLDANFAVLPQWFNEGLAEFYSSFEADDEKVEFGHPLPNHLFWLRNNPMIPLDELFTIDARSKDYNEGSRVGVFYAQSWALVHYLLMSNEGAKWQMSHYLGLVAAGRPGDEAFRDAFGTDPAKLLEELDEYVDRPKFNFMKLELPALKVDTKVRVQPLRREDLLSRLGELLLNLGPRAADDAEAHFQAALALNGSCVEAHLGLALLRDLQNDFAKAAEHYRKALELDGADARAYLRYGYHLLDQVPDAPSAEGSSRTAEAREAFKKSLQLSPDSALAYVGLGTTYVYDHGTPPGTAVAALERALTLLPTRRDVAFKLALVHARRGNRTRAESLFQQRYAPQAKGWVLLQAHRALSKAEALGATELVRSGKPAAGVGIYETLAFTVLDIPVRMELLQQLREAESFLDTRLRDAGALTPEQAGAARDALQRIRKLLPR